MKKFLVVLLTCLPLLAFAKGPVDAKYLAGAVPTENGIVTFRKSFSVPGKSSEDIYRTISQYVRQEVVEKAVPGLRTRIISDEQAERQIVARVEEFMVFKKKALNYDRTRFRYQISATVNGNKVELILNQISYYYNEDQKGENGTPYKAEEWITDENALTKKGNKLYPYSGKFRIKTVDRVEAIFEGAMDAFEAKESAVPQKKVRKAVIE